MRKKSGFTLIELAVVAVLMGCVFAICAPFILQLLGTGMRQGTRFQKLEALEKISHKIRQDIRASKQVFIRDNGKGLALEIPLPNSPSPLYVSYNMKESEPDSLYRCEFAPGKQCVLTRMIRNIKSWKVTLQKGNGSLISVEIMLDEQHSKNPPLSCVIKTGMRHVPGQS